MCLWACGGLNRAKGTGLGRSGLNHTEHLQSSRVWARHATINALPRPRHQTYANSSDDTPS